MTFKFLCELNSFIKHQFLGFCSVCVPQCHKKTRRILVDNSFPKHTFPFFWPRTRMRWVLLEQPFRAMRER